jgi:hypothetical protein
MNPNNQPEICNRMRAVPQPQVDRMLSSTSRDGNNNNLTGTSSSFQHFSSRRSSRIPHIINFGVKLKITQVLSAKSASDGSDCLLLPIGQVAFARSLEYSEQDSNGSESYSAEETYRGLSCYENTVLHHCFITCPNNTALNRHLETVLMEEEVSSGNLLLFYYYV